MFTRQEYIVHADALKKSHDDVLARYESRQTLQSPLDEEGTWLEHFAVNGDKLKFNRERLLVMYAYALAGLQAEKAAA